jgi:NADP-dependent alcohol dehydrogenase
MLDFDFYNPTRIFFGKDKLGYLDSFIPASARVLITYGGGSVVRSGLLDKVKSALGGRKVVEFGGIEPNPHFETIVRAAAVVKKEQIDFLLAVGGGSVIDGTKFLALAGAYAGDPDDLMNFGFRPITPDIVRALPIGTILTLPASGSEMNNGCVITYKGTKRGIFCDMQFPAFSILDPTVTFTLPANQVANGIVDTFSHALEQYLTFPVDGRLQDRFSEGILQTLVEIGPASVGEPENYEVRANQVWCAALAFNGLIGAGVPSDWASHMIGHELTTLFHIDHGQTLAVVLPALMEVRRNQKRAKLLQYAGRVWGIDRGGDEDRISLAIQKTREFFESLGVKTHLSDYGVRADQIHAVADSLTAQGMTALSETHDLTPDIVTQILEKAM